MVSNSAFFANICKIDIFFQYIQLMGKVNNSLFFCETQYSVVLRKAVES